ncbi:MAG: bifunctional PIG-L family deacetylase/class I SAM-dependent methyltransferase [Microbacterium sp.]|uniref:bifunctional PIG-L family deacetylase/class I SAM-dependent methyltransferase n=1 Tax=Microbacterium sp. TaxID=51671 RepID=UPI00271D33FC|nr:bifunctional PIG-L family deacetylase/class I SAM-dependent methyltransferase [Microbacterium sp.]MDO8384711.1 bifunctional PIG-L family deacetylase/class I SAM-dependent methyltransferase [Microbacterium sp.]
MSVAFDHREPGIPESEWQRARPWATARPLDLDVDVDIDVLIVLAAHPDDETLGAGGLIATAALRGIRVVVVVATDGDASHPDSPTWPRQALARERRVELTRAIDLLAPGSALSFLGLPDGQLREHRKRLTRQVRSAILEETTEDPLRTLVVAPWRGDGHRDHRVLGEVAEEFSAELGHRALGYPIWFWHWAHPSDTGIGTGIATESWTVLTLGRTAHAAKRRALTAHATQVRPLSSAPGDEALIHEGMRAHFERDVEVFVVPASGGGGAESLAPSFFEDFYARHDDPWGFDTRWYEERKRALMMAVLPRAHFRDVLELGCATGALTVELATRADRVLGLDASDEALARAHERLERQGDAEHVTLERATLPSEWPEGEFELIVMSEIGYYWSRSDLLDAARRTVASLSSDGVLVACHWRHAVAEYPGTADDVHATLRDLPGLRLLARHEEEDFFLDVLVHSGTPSVARAAGLVR